MSLDFQKFYRFLLPGAILVASNFFIVIELFKLEFTTVGEATSLILFLGILAIIFGVPLYWIYMVLHFLFERHKMQKDEVKWLTGKTDLGKETVFNDSNLIWHYIDSENKNERFANWLRTNFLLIHSLGCSLVALIGGFVINLIVKEGTFFQETKSLVWLFWSLIGICIFYYRHELKRRYM